jgi:nitroreductase
MTCILLEKLDLPKSCRLGSTIFKKQFLNSGDLSSADKKLISKHIDKVIWQASLKPTTINIQPYKDDVREYGEVEVIEVKLYEMAKVMRIAEMVMRSIPYPILLQFTHENQLMIVVGHSRTNLNDSSKNTIEEFLFTEWIHPAELTVFQKQFFTNIHASKLSSTNFYRFYDDFVNQVILLNASKWADGYFEDRDAREVKQISDQIASLERQLNDLRSALNKETQFNRKVELNVKIKRHQKKINRLIQKRLDSKFDGE